MTCDEILAQIAELTNVFNTLDTQIKNGQSQANFRYLAVLQQDTFGGTYPGQPLTAAAIQARITYLMPMMPATMAVIAAYMTLLQLLNQIAGWQATQAQVVTMLGGFKQQAVDQGC